MRKPLRQGDKTPAVIGTAFPGRGLGSVCFVSAAKDRKGAFLRQGTVTMALR